jgi:hypothetical protein
MSSSFTSVAPDRGAPKRGHEPSRVPTAPVPVTSPIQAGPSSREVLRLQGLAGNRAVGRYLAGRARPRICLQRFVDRSDAEKIFPRLREFTTLDEKSRNAFRAALRLDESADHGIRQAFHDMLATVAGITLTHSDGRRVAVNDLDVQISLNWLGDQLDVRIASPPNVSFDQRTFGLVRQIGLEGGTPYVYESRIDIGKGYQGGGAGAVITRSGLAFAEALGINKLTIEASDVGRYAWAAMGFEPNEGQWDKIASGMLDALERNVPEQWPQETATPVVTRYLPPVDLKATGDALAKEIREKHPEPPPEFDLDAHLVDAAIAALKPFFLPAARTITDDDDFFGDQAPPESWIELLTEDDLATYLARKALSQLLANERFRGELTASLGLGKRLGASKLSIGQDPPTELGLPQDALERLLMIISSSTRAEHSLNDVVVLARELKDRDARSAEFIRELVKRSETWKGSAKLDDEIVMKRFKTSVGWKA